MKIVQKLFKLNHVHSYQNEADHKYKTQNQKCYDSYLGRVVPSKKWLLEKTVEPKRKQEENWDMMYPKSDD